MKTLLGSLLLIGCIALLVTCSKEYSFEGGKGTAVYTFLGAPNDCQQSTIAGNYYIGSPLTNDNTVSLTVNVTTIGSYNVSTTTGHGISFSGAGNFADTGTQQIVLTGAGIPDSTGVISFSIPGNSGCTFSVNVTNAPPADLTLTGSPNDCDNPDIKGTYLIGKNTGDTNTVNLNVTVNTLGDYSITTDTLNGISFSGSGTFTTTGSQKITLKASGAPIDPGIVYFTVKAGTSQCSFPVNIVNAEPFATYVLQSAIGVCFHTLHGDYFSNTPLAASDTVEVLVYVRDLGNFTISSTKVNGMMFSRSGTFTTTGDQFVTLIGSGTPQSAGKYTLTPMIIGPAPIGGVGCSFDVTVQ
jgi:hypothetical protein